MVTIGTNHHLPAFGEHERRETGNILQATLVELIDLSLLGKQMHWTIVGALFRPLHLYLDELTDEWRELADTVAERAVAVGFFVDGQAPAIAASGSLARLERGPIEDHEVVRELTRYVADVSERVRERVERLGELDAASQDVLVEALRTLEEQQWMLRSQLARAAV